MGCLSGGSAWFRMRQLGGSAAAAAKRVGAEIGWMELSFCLNGCTNRELMVRVAVSCTIFCKCNKWIGSRSKKTALHMDTHVLAGRRSSNLSPAVLSLFLTAGARTRHTTPE